MREIKECSGESGHPKGKGTVREARRTPFADVINSTHTGCLSRSTIEGAELSIPPLQGFANDYREIMWRGSAAIKT